MNDWLAALHQHLVQGEALVRVVVAATRGSVPREPGAVMLVGAQTVKGTIGGGHLEWKAIDIARNMLAQKMAGDCISAKLDHFTLGATLGQCCGGAVELWFEHNNPADLDFIATAKAARALSSLLVTRLAGGVSSREIMSAEQFGQRYTSATIAHLGNKKSAMLMHAAGDEYILVEHISQTFPQLVLFGAGHVGQALVRVLTDMPLQILWVDNRENIFPATLPANVTSILSEEPAAEVRFAQADASYLVLTHDHQLDYEICHAILKRADFHWAGLIGSRTKALRFRQRFAVHGISEENIMRLTCPIGTPGIQSKLPAAIAIAVAAQLIAAIECTDFANTDQSVFGPSFFQPTLKAS